MKTKSQKMNKKSDSPRYLNLIVILTMLMVLGFFASPQIKPALAATLLSANFNTDTNGFAYQDDSFGTTQPSYASGTRTASGGYGSSGGLQVSLGGVDANAISGMSGAWSYPLSLASAENGVLLSFRYKLDQSATYEFDEFSRVLVKLDTNQYGRGAKNYVDHIGGDGSSSQGNSSTFLPTTDWQQVEIYLGNLSSGSHTLVLGGYNNKKDASDETTTLVIDDVVLTSGNSAPITSDALTLVNRTDINQFLGFNQGVAQFHDRCRGSSMGCSSTDYSTNYFNALTWVESQLQAMGYTTVRHTFTSNGGGTNLYATKIGSTTPTQMYMISTHLDGRGGGDAFNDDGSGVALVLEAARVFANSDVTTDKSIRFIFWDKEELGLYGSTAYASSDTASGGRRSLQGTLAEPTWLGIVQHDMILYDHGAGSIITAQSAYADLDVEWRAGTTKEADSKALALKWRFLAGQYASDYPATAYNYSTNTDDTPFHPYVASISVRENRRSLTSGSNAEWINPYYHTTNDRESSYTRDDDGDGKRDDIELGYNAVRATIGLLAELVGVQITGPNQAPTANPQSLSTPEDTPLAITLSGSDPDGNPLSYQVISNPTHGALSGSPPNLTYTPTTNYFGTDSFQFVVNDGQVNSPAATVNITINPVNDPPVANPQALATNEDSAKPITLSGSDPEGSPLTYSVVSVPSHGSLSGTAPNLTYIPAANYNGADSFTFKVNDGTIDSSPATVNITINPVNDVPIANPQNVVTAEDTALAIILSGSDVDGNPLIYSIANGPSHGTLTGAVPNLVYTPFTNYNGSDSFTFVANDGSVNSAPATVSITVNPVNDLPVALDQSVTTSQDTSVAITISGSDADGDSLSYIVLSPPTHGVLSGVAPELVYTPNSGYNGPDSFTFEVNDGQASSAPATVSITVTRTNGQPVANAQSVNTAEDTPVEITLTGSDPNGDPLTFLIVSGPANGVLSGDSPALTYTPNSNFNGSDSFSFVANDGLVDSLPVTVAITVISINDAPVANPQAVTLSEDSSVVITLSGSDVDGDGLIYSLVTSPTHGVLSGAAPSLTYVAAANYFGPDSFTFLVNDGQVDSAPVTINITVTPVNDLPVANAQSVTTSEDVSIPVILSGSDIDGNPLTYRIVNGPSHGSLSGSAPNLTYVPAANYFGLDSFTFKVNDGTSDSAVATVSITIDPINDPPLANPQSVTTQQDAAISITLTGSDAEADPLTFQVISAPVNGSLTGISPNLVYTPNPGFNGSDSFQFIANDGQLDSAPATVNITVTANGPLLYLGSSTSGTAGGVSFADEDILVKNVATGAWSLYFDGSDVGLANTDVDAFELQTDGSLLMSFDTDFSLTNFGAVDDSDILRFIPTSLGATTAGTWQWYFDGSDVGLSTSDEDVDAFTLLADGRLIVSTRGSVSVTGASGADEDLLVFAPTGLGSTTSGTWAMYFDGSDVGLASTSDEDVNGVWVDAAGKIYLTTLGSFSVTGVSGDGSDIFVCTPSSLGSTTTCTFSMYWDGSANGFSGEDTDSFSIVP